MPKIGLEIHGYIQTKEKLFCTCKAEHGAKHASPNSNICPICTSQPGSKPMLPNSEAIKKVIEIALILNCEVNENIIWQRKHYNWPDLPKGYQNTISGAHAKPVGVKGEFLGIKILECHLEEDPAAWNPETGEIDYNRSGSPLIEIVTAPDFTSSSQVVEWLNKLIITLDYLKAIDKKAGIKADVNVSLPEKKTERTELKNINSITNIRNAIDSEIERHKKELPIKAETRAYNPEKNTSSLMRLKEAAEDYRFISDPDLPVIKVSKSRIKQLKENLPETPNEKLQKLIKKYKIPEKHAEILTKKLDIVEFFEKIINEVSPKLAIRWVTEELLSVLNYNKKELEDLNINPSHFIELLNLIEKNKITELKAKDLLRSWTVASNSPLEAVKSQTTISNKTNIESFIEKAIKENAQAVADFKSGNVNALNFLVGKVMALSNKRADYKVVKEILEKRLKP